MLSISVIETIGAIDGNVVIEQNGTVLSGDEPVLVTNQDMKAKVVIKNSKRLSNASYSWFIDDIAFEPSSSPQIIYRFDYPKVYKIMAVILANDTQSETINNKNCITKVGIISRKINVIQHNSTKEVIKTLNDILKDLQSMRYKRRQALEGESYTIYGAMIIGGAILITLVFISVLIHAISICDKWVFRKNEAKIPLIDKNMKKYRTYTP